MKHNACIFNSTLLVKTFCIVAALSAIVLCLYFATYGRVISPQSVYHHKPAPEVAPPPVLTSPQLRETSEEEFEARLQRVRNVCRSNRSLLGNGTKVFTNQQGLLYCLVPKAGCTFWKRIFYVTDIHPEKSVANMFKIPRAALHKDAGFGVPYNWTLHTPLLYPTRLLVSRDPYSRLLSSYLDKIYLPDFWATHLKDMMIKLGNVEDGTGDDFMRTHFNEMVKTPEFKYPKFTDNLLGQTQKENGCFKYVTFEQFVRGTFRHREPHWNPIHEICNPCTLSVTHVGKMETFTDDARTVLTKVGLEDLLEDFEHDAQVDLELEMIVEYNYEVLHRGRYQKFLFHCLTDHELAYRLWQNFQWRGYIDPDVNYVISAADGEMEVRQSLMEQLWRAREGGLRNPEKMKNHKKNFQTRLFQTLSKELFKAITSKYYIDMELFDYENKYNALKDLYP